MAELKTKKNDANVYSFISSVADETKRNDCLALIDIMKTITGSEPRMWGSSIVGFGSYHYKYKSGREGDWFLTGFSPRKGSLTLYLMPGLEILRADLEALGKFKTGKGCLYINRLEDVDQVKLKMLIRNSVQHLRKMYKP